MPNFPESVTTYYATLIQSLCDISDAYLYEGKMDDSVNILTIGEQLAEAKEIAPRDTMKLLLQYSKVLIMNYFLANSDYDAMLSTVLRAKQTAEGAQDEQGKADAVQLLGQVYYYQSLNNEVHEYEQALEYFQQALDRRVALGDERGISESLFYIGLIYQNGDTPDKEKAFDYYTRSFHIAEKHDYKLEASYASRHLASVLGERKELEQALIYALRSLALREEIGFKRYLPPSHGLVGEIYFAQHDLESALFHNRRAYELAQEMNLQIFMMWSLFSLGDIYLTQYDTVQAKEHFEQAYNIAQEFHLPYAIKEIQEKLHQFPD
jgi:tetratricopeptide (TPR) repeat protein